MEVRFNGKSITISQVSKEMIAVILNNASKNINKYSNELSKVFEDAYRIVLTSRLGVGYYNKGVATEALKNSISIKKESVTFTRNGKRSGVIRLKHSKKFNEYGWYIGLPENEKFELFSGKGTDLVSKIETWIRNKKGGRFDFSHKWLSKYKNKERAVARLIVVRWGKGGKNRNHVLPKWYDVFKDGNKEALNALYRNKTRLENSIKKILNG